MMFWSTAHVNLDCSDWPRVRFAIRILVGCLLVSMSGGCLPSGETSNSQVLVYGRKGFDPGRFIKPRAITIDPATDEVYVVDMTGRIQVLIEMENSCAVGEPRTVEPVDPLACRLLKSLHHGTFLLPLSTQLHLQLDFFRLL